MPYKVPQNRTHDIQRLSRALKAKQQQLSNLEADHHQLSHRHYLLASSCDLLQLLATLKQSANRTQSLDKLHQPTATAESEALQQLRRLQYQQNPPVSHTDRDTSCDIPSGSSSYSSNSSNCHPFSLLQLEEAETLGTFEDPLRALRSQLLHEDIDPYPGIQELTVEQMQADYRSMIHQLALNVGFLDNPISRSRDDDNNPYAAIKRLVTSHTRVLTALLLRGRTYMIPLFFMSDVVSGQQVEEHDPTMYDYAASKLGLTDVQRQNIQGILSVYRTLLGGVLEKRYTVQYVLALASGSGSSGAVPDSSGGTSALPVPSVVGLTAVNDTSNITHNSGTDGGSLASGSSITETESAEAFSKKALSQQQHQLMEERQQQQQNISQVVRLLQKESLLKACCWCSIEGCLTWTQLAKLLIACYPFRASPLNLAQAVERSLAADNS